MFCLEQGWANNGSFATSSISAWFLLTLLHTCCATKEDTEYDEVPTHLNVPRTFRFFSRGPDPDSPKYEGRKISQHWNNVIEGGTIGIEMDTDKYVGKWNKLWRKLKKYMPEVRHFDKRSEFQPKEEPSPEFEEEAEDLVGRGFINPRAKPPARFEDREREW
ncbi:uncharacterized protein TNCT_542341 [Trichonephila clavata]|uniref:Secreted protein n=1 Tax=Trichonephila clavata TaxID=2740835 RepID=A0A8X6IA64_TRICU|nr:uncharacterized protein TNCT_542341 [Trichonephila clavata]